MPPTHSAVVSIDCPRCNDVIACTGLIDGVGQIKPQPDGTATTQYDVRDRISRSSSPRTTTRNTEPGAASRGFWMLRLGW
ncbi:hypothetical protein [Mycobacteroides abscessus]|uniref:hypothetical protein n=1 Tax=Mycobacteroides abscessus TaxID=36809 RepID=UPI0018964CE8